MIEPWEKYSHIWKTKSAFFTYLRGAIRKSVWNLYPPKLDFKNKVCKPPPEGIETRAKTGAFCALSGEWVGKSKGEIDHKVGNVSLNDWEDLLPFVEHLCLRCEGDNLQLVTKEAHKIKSYAEKHNISYQEAKIQKETINICKGDEKEWLLERGITPASNAKKRRQQVLEELSKND
jgi:hypothetical protein